jgi:hypothetical protein
VFEYLSDDAVRRRKD